STRSGRSDRRTRSFPYDPRWTPVRTISLYPLSTRRFASSTALSSGRLTAVPRTLGMMQNEQLRSQPSSTLRNARVWRSNREIVRSKIEGAVSSGESLGSSQSVAFSSWVTTRRTPGSPRNSDLWESAAQPVTVISENGNRRASRRTVRCASDVAVSVTVQVLMTKRSAPRSASTSVSPLRENRSRSAWDSYWLTLQPKVTNAKVFIGAGSIEKGGALCHSGRIDREPFRFSPIPADLKRREGEGCFYGQPPVRGPPGGAPGLRRRDHVAPSARSPDPLGPPAAL